MNKIDWDIKSIQSKDWKSNWWPKIYILDHQHDGVNGMLSVNNDIMTHLVSFEAIFLDII